MTDDVKAPGQPADEGLLCEDRRDDAMRLLVAMNQVEERYVLESSAPGASGKDGDADASGAAARATSGAAGYLRRYAPGLGLAACVLAAGLVAFGGNAGTLMETFTQTGTSQVTQVTGTQAVLDEPDETGQASEKADGQDVADSQDAAAGVSVASSDAAQEEALSAGGDSAVATRAVQDAAAGADGAGEAQESAPTLGGDDTALVAIANPWQECADLAQACDLAGFGMTVAQAPQGSVEASTYIQVIPGEIVELDYYDALDERVAYVRKAVGSEDVSGDYNAYDLTQTLDVDGVQVEARGSDEGWSCVTWTDGDYSYAIGFLTPASTEQVEALVGGIE